MRRGDNQELKMLWLLVIFLRKTDEDHPMSVNEIINDLGGRGINVKRHTLYHAFNMLREMGLDIVKTKRGRYTRYYLKNRDFELAEAKLLVDSVQSAKFITEETSKKLIRKIEFLVSKYQGKQLQRDVYLTGRVKTSNLKVYDNVDRLHEAIRGGRQIKFMYKAWMLDGTKPKLVPRRDDEYQVSPYYLMNNDGNYYLVAYSPKDEEIRHYRVDKMEGITLQDETREGRELFEQFDLPKYARSVFGMFGGEEMNVVIEGTNDMVGVMIDRFGKKNITFSPRGENHFRLITNVVVSNKFFEWIFSLGDNVKVTGPPIVVEQMQDEIRRLARLYDV